MRFSNSKMHDRGCERLGKPDVKGAHRAVEVTWFLIVTCLFSFGAASNVSAANVPAGFTETIIPGPSSGNWNEAVGITFEESSDRMFVWERAGRVWFKDPDDASFSSLLDIREEVGDWGDYGCIGFAVDPNFQVNGYIYLLYTVDRHHLLYFGTPNYRSSSNEYNNATIGRLTRYTCRSSDGFRSVDPTSRLILIGETKTNGFPMCSDTHGVGSLVFGEDGTLLVSCGDGASASDADAGGTHAASFAPQALADGIIRAKEDVGAFRSQLVDCLNGKVLRIDPATGNGISSNPFYDPANPRSARSRVWTLGLRNPFRMSLRPESGSHNPADGKPGVLYVGNVGWYTWESLFVVTGPRQNFGWPVYEGLSVTPLYNVTDPFNLDAPNSRYPASGCSQYFTFKDLIDEDSTNAAAQPPFANPCFTSQKITNSIPQFLHKRSVLDWSQTSATTITPTYGSSGQAQTATVGAPGSPVSGVQFQGNCSVGGTWYTGTNFPALYQNTYFHADWGQGVIKNMTFTTNDKPQSVNNFANNGGAIVCMVQHPSDGSLYYVTYTYGDAGTVRKLDYTGNRTPIAVASADQYYGSNTLTVQFSGSGSSDPDGQAITYSWNFGDGSPANNQPNPSHAFSAPVGVATKFNVTLTVTDSGGLPAQATLVIALNDTPPNVTITSPVDGSLYSPTVPTTVNLAATVSDAESVDNQLSYQWQVLLHHNNHNHVIAVSTNHVTTAVLSPVGCDGINIYYYRVLLTVTDPSGIATTREVELFPNCGASDTPPSISVIPDQTTTLGATVGPLNFTIGDAQTAAGNLQLSSSSSNPALIPNNNIEFGGSGSNRTVTVTPTPLQNGTATITVTVNDGPFNVSDSFVVTVTGSNTPPTISSIPNQSTPEGTVAGPIGFTVGDVGTPVDSLTLSGGSSNSGLVPASNIVFGGSGSNRTVTVTPVGGQSGTATITVTVNDGLYGTSTNFLLTVNGLPPGTRSFTNGAAITIPDSGSGIPYPSTISMSGLGGVISNVTVSVRGLSHTWKGDVDILLVSPGGQKVILMSDTGNAFTPSGSVTLTFSDSAAAFLPASSALVTGTFKPTDFSPSDMFNAPAPAGPYGTNLSALNGQSANGTWSLYVMDDGAGDQGNIATGWSLTVVTASGGPQAPTIGDIANQSTTMNTPTAAIPFTVGDPDTAVASLTLSGGSSSTGLVPTNNIVFGGSGANRTVTVTPATGQTGSATITVTVSDGALSANDTFVLTVNSVNTPPTISVIADQVINEDTSTAALAFTVGDAETAAGSLTLGKASSNAALVPTNSIVFGGSGANRTVTVTPAAHQSGTATITVSVNDGQFTVSSNFLVTVTAVNDAPTITPIANQTISVNGTTGPLSVTVGDVETAAGSLTLRGDSSNTNLVATNNIVFGGSASNRTVTVTPAAGQSGTATITISVSDGALSASNSFVLTVSSQPPGTKSFTNGAAITILDNAAASPYPSTISVSGLGGVISNVTVSLRGLSHTWKGDIDALLVSPGGQKVIVMSDAGNAFTASGSVTVTLSDSAAAFLPASSALATGTFKPTDYAPADTFNAPAPAGPYGTNLSGFNGQSANGTWSLYVMDDGAGDQGSIATGWSLTVVTASGGSQAPTIGDILNQSTTMNTPTAAIPFTVGDADTVVASLTLSGGSSNTNLVTTSSIVFGGSGSNRTVTVTPVTGQTGSATITVTVSDGALSANDSFVLTVNAVNTPPTISGIADQVINEDTSTAALAFTVGDAETAAGSLTLGKGSSNTTLVPINNIVFGGSGANRTVTVTPATNQNGTTTITVSVNDGQFTVSSNFLVTVTAVNDAPTISGISNQTISVNGTTGPLSVTVGDVETAAGSLTLRGDSSNTNLVATNNIVFGGSASNRTVTVTPAAGQSGTATITISVSDGALSASNSFVLTVSSQPPGTRSFTNGVAITIPSLGSASPYPSTISVSGLGGAISNVTMSLRGLTHTWKGDIDALLVSPGGQKVLVMSDAGNVWTPSGSVTLTLSDSASAFLPASSALTTGTFKPTDYANGLADTFNAPAPAGPYGTNFSTFNGQSANGTWSLYVMDDGAGDQGSIATGWSLTIATATAPGPISISIELPPQITGLEFDEQGAIRVTINGQAGLSYALEASSDQFKWTQVDVQDNETGSVVLSEERTTNSIRFYRAVSVP